MCTLAPPVSLDEDDAAVLGRVVDFYHACLKRTPAALAYLEKRGIADPAAIETFKLGFADRTLGLRLPDKRKREGAVAGEVLSIFARAESHGVVAERVAVIRLRGDASAPYTVLEWH